MNRNKDLKINWLTVLIFAVLLIMGWINIYAASIKGTSISIWDLDYDSGKQLVWILVAGLTGVVILSLDTKFIEFTSYFFYGLCIFLLLMVLVAGREVNGSKSWFELGFIRIQPSEFMKLGAALALSKFMSRVNFSMRNTTDVLTAIAMISFPMILIILQRDTGTALVFTSFFFVFFREGLSLLYVVFIALMIFFSILAIVANQVLIVIAILSLAFVSYYFIFKSKHLNLHIFIAGVLVVLVLSIDVVINDVLQPHQSIRVQALFNQEIDPLGANWNTTQSKIAIGSGGLIGKGFMNGTQTKYDFVPQQSTDFIFCTVGEEQGWIGSLFVLGLLFLLLYQLIYMAETAKSDYARIFGYSVTSILFFHILINVSMTIGLAPVIGIPLPFFSYGGSSLLTFTALVFVMLNLFSQRVHMLTYS